MIWLPPSTRGYDCRLARRSTWALGRDGGTTVSDSRHVGSRWQRIVGTLLFDASLAAATLGIARMVFGDAIDLGPGRHSHLDPVGRGRRSFWQPCYSWRPPRSGRRGGPAGHPTTTRSPPTPCPRRSALWGPGPPTSPRRCPNPHACRVTGQNTDVCSTDREWHRDHSLTPVGTDGATGTRSCARRARTRRQVFRRAPPRTPLISFRRSADK